MAATLSSTLSCEHHTRVSLVVIYIIHQIMGTVSNSTHLALFLDQTDLDQMSAGRVSAEHIYAMPDFSADFLFLRFVIEPLISNVHANATIKYVLHKSTH